MISKKEILSIANKFKENFQEYKTPEGARGKSFEACVMFLNLAGLDEEQIAEKIVVGQRSVGGIGPVEDHYLVSLGSYYIDPTARQYKPDAPFPMMWERSLLRKN